MMVQAQQEQGEDKAVYKELDDSLVRAATTASNLEAEQDSGNINKTQSKATHNEPNPQGTGSGSGPRCQENMGDTIAQTRSARVIFSEEAGLGDQEDASKQERKIDDIDKDAEITLVNKTHGRYGDDLMFDTSDLAGKEVFVAEQGVPDSKKDDVVSTHVVATTVSNATTTVLITPEEINLAQAIEELKIAKARDKDKGKMEVRLAREKAEKEEEANIVSWDNVQAMIDANYQMAQQMQAEEQEKLSIEEKSKLFVQLLEARKKHFAAIRAQKKRNKPPTKAQKRKTMSTYLNNMAGYKHNQLMNKSFNDIQKLFDKAIKRVNTFVDMDTELVKGSEVRAEGNETREEGSSKRAGEELECENAKKQKVDKDRETAELKRLMEGMLDEEEVALDAIPLAVKSPSIIDWKIHKEGKKSYYQIIRTDGSLKMYLVFSHMLKSFDREDLETLYKLVKAKYGSTRPVEDLDLVLYGDLKTMFEPHVEDNVWKNQSDYRVLDWKLYDSCGVHSLRKQNVYIHMLVEKRYPLTAQSHI
ncbi:hypothetical protein Tco_0477301 [Tanacetum coccineum]